jgi:hypothetical protein
MMICSSAKLLPSRKGPASALWPSRTDVIPSEITDQRSLGTTLVEGVGNAFQHPSQTGPHPDSVVSVASGRRPVRSRGRRPHCAPAAPRRVASDHPGTPSHVAVPSAAVADLLPCAHSAHSAHRPPQPQLATVPQRRPAKPDPSQLDRLNLEHPDPPPRILPRMPHCQLPLCV